MEKDGIYSHGASAIFSEKMFDHADGCNLIYCKTCGSHGNYDVLNNKIYSCTFC